MFLKLFGKKKGGSSSNSGAGPRLVNGVDREMKYCPSCGGEYRPDVSSCMSCDVELISGEERLTEMFDQERAFENRSMDIGPGDNLVAIRKGPIKEMKALKQVLAKERIASMLGGDEANCGKGCCGSPEMYLQIKETDLEMATVVLAKEFVATTALDLKDLEHAEAVFDHQASETTCPACGCTFSPTVGACPECGLCFE